MTAQDQEYANRMVAYECEKSIHRAGLGYWYVNGGQDGIELVER